MSYIKDQHDKEVLETLKRIASSLEKIEQHMCAAKVNDESSGLSQEREEKVAVCPKCKMQHVLSPGELDYAEHYGFINIVCHNCKHIFMVDKKEPIPVPDHKVVMCPRCESETVLSKGYLEELDTYGSTNVYCPHCTNIFRINKEGTYNGRYV